MTRGDSGSRAGATDRGGRPIAVPGAGIARVAVA